MKKHYKEFFYSEDPKTLETERKKRGALHAIFPHLMGGSEDHTSDTPHQQRVVDRTDIN